MRIKIEIMVDDQEDLTEQDLFDEVKLKLFGVGEYENDRPLRRPHCRESIAVLQVHRRLP